MSVRTRLDWSFPALLALAIMLPLALFGWTAWNERARTLDEAERTAVRTVAALHEHVAKVLETNELVLDEANRRIEGRSWDEIEGDRRLWEDLSRIARNLGQVRTISLIDGEGRVRMTSLEFPVRAIRVEDRDYFQAQKDRDAGTFVGMNYTGRIVGDRLIAFSRRRTSQAAAFDGVVQVATPVSYFTAFWEQFAPTIAHIIPLVRADGQVIARYPALDNPKRLSVAGPFLSRALVQPQGTYRAVSQVDGIERLNAYARVKDYPLFISFSIETRAILARWREALALYGVYAALALAALLAAALMALRQLRGQEAASLRWQETADQLASEMAAREKAETALRHAQKMEAVGQLTGGVAHDFNNLLMAVLGSLEVLKKRLPADPRVERLLNNAIQGAERGAALTKRMLAFARKQELTPEPVDVPALIRGMTDLLERSVGPRVAIETHFPIRLSRAHVDANQLELAILNLAVNARDAMPGGGTLTIAAYEETVAAGDGSGLRPGPYVVVCMADTGSGMDEATLARAAEPFFTTKGVGKGTGLGLSMVHGLAAQSGGRLLLKSRMGQGTTAELWLPRSETEASLDAVPERPDLAPKPSACTVLVVDDDSLVLTGTAAMLDDLGSTVVTAGSGQEALDKLRTGLRVDLVLTDQMMPGMTGLQLVREVRSLRPDVPVILATGFAELPLDTDPDLIRMRKPFAQNELAEALAKSLESQKVRGRLHS